jgi:HK97 family phage major capsid protein
MRAGAGDQMPFEGNSTVASEVAKSLNDTRLRLHDELKGLNATLVTEKRNAFTADEKIKYENLHNELDSVDTRLREMLADEKRAAETSSAFEDLGGRQATNLRSKNQDVDPFTDRARKFLDRDDRSVNSLDIGDWRDSRLVGRLIENRSTGAATQFPGGGLTPYEARVLYDNYVGGGTPGSFSNPSGAGLVPIDFYDQMISYLIEVSGLMQCGPSVINSQGGEPLQIPYVTNQTGQTTAGAQVVISAQQGAPLPGADPGFGQKTLSSNKFGILVQVARELIDDSGINLLQYLAMSAGRAVGNMLGTSLVNGTNGISGGILGAPVAVTGGLSNAVSASYGVSGITGAPTYDNLIDMEYSIIAPYRQSRSCYWLAADKTLGLLRKLVDTNARPIWEPSTILGSPDLLLGKPLVADPFMPAYGSSAKSIAFGDFSQYFVRLIGGVRFERSDDFAFNTDLVTFRAIVRADGQLMNPPTAITTQPLQLFQGGAS